MVPTLHLISLFPLIASLMLSPPYCAGFEPFSSLGDQFSVISPSPHIEQCPFQGHGYTPWHFPHLPNWLTTFLSSHYPATLYLYISSLHLMFGIFLGPLCMKAFCSFRMLVATYRTVQRQSQKTCIIKQFCENLKSCTEIFYTKFQVFTLVFSFVVFGIVTV
jgi:hypothetical protein